MCGWVHLRLDAGLLMIGGLGLLGVVAFAVLLAGAGGNGPGLAVNHDFGIVDLSDSGLSLQHTFVLQNRSRMTMEIQKVSTTCGCTEASVDADRVAPGGTVRVSATLHLSEPGTREARVLVDTDQEGLTHIVFTLRATARRARQIETIERWLDILPGGTASIGIFAIVYESDDAPMPPQLSASASLTAAFDRWTLVHPRHTATGHPARWQGRVEVVAASVDPADHAAMLEISSAGSPTISIPVRIRPPSGGLAEAASSGSR